MFKKFFWFTVIVLSLFGWLKWNGYYVSCLSDSLPPGVYKRISKLPSVGDYAAFQLDPALIRYGLKRGYLKPHVLLMKKIFAEQGDGIERKNNQIQVDGRVIDRVLIAPQDSQHRSLDIFYPKKIILKPGEYWMMSDYNPRSWDSRYFGAVTIKFILRPIWIW
ncbi:MAG: S26 family signal peptidase [Candidatus Omnitrophica bacterium]|nr:S26 family signal peptidase [Candidatus Omnitrophota bacterium]